MTSCSRPAGRTRTSTTRSSSAPWTKAADRDLPLGHAALVALRIGHDDPALAPLSGPLADDVRSFVSQRFDMREHGSPALTVVLDVAPHLDVEVQPVLDGLALRDLLDEHPWPIRSVRWDDRTRVLPALLGNT